MNAWAILVDGNIAISTVAPTDVGAMAIWLVAVHGAAVSQDTPDGNIREVFDILREQQSVSIECCPIELRRALQ